MKHYELIVIGSGPAGEKAAVKAAYHNHSVALIEKDHLYGGAGTQTGTLPSKTLKESAIYYSGIRDAGIFGIERKLERAPKIKDFFFRKDHVSRVSSDDIEKNLLFHKVDIYRGRAAFTDPHTVAITGPENHTLSGDHILIATGSYPFQIPGIPFDGVHVHDSDTILNLPRFPESLVIVGAGVIGCEYATMFAVMGSQVTLVNGHQRFLTFLDEEIVELLRRYMEGLGIRFLMETRVDSVNIIEREDRDLVRAHLSNGTPLEAEMFLYAAGRSGNTADLNLQAAGVQTGERQTILVDGDYRTNVPHIFAAGDVIGFPALASTSMDQGRVAVSKMFGLSDLTELDKQFPYGIYTIPEVSCVGLTEQDCIKRGIDYGVGRARFDRLARGRIMGFTKGMLKLVFDRQTEIILGVHIVGVQATETIHFGMLLVEEKMPLHRLISMVFNFPTLHELYKYAAYDGLSNLHPSGLSGR